MAGNKSVILSLLGNNAKAREAIAQVGEEIEEVQEKAKKPLVIGGDTEDAIGPITELDDALKKYKIAATEAADAQERLTKLQEDSESSAAQLAAANKTVADSTKNLRNAQLELGKAELKSGDDAKVAAAKQEELAAQQKIAGDTAEVAGDKQVVMGKKAKTAGDESAGAAEKSKMHYGLLAAGLVVAGGVMVDMAAKFQEANTHLVTDAGESAGAMGKVAKGMLDISSTTGVSATEISKAMFTVESAGFHYANGGLTVMMAVAKGAKATGTDVSDMANGVTSALNAYGFKANKAAEVTSQLIATVSAGKMRMQDLATSLSNVLPVAASAGISLGQVGGALATMTSTGTSADQASQNLANAIRALIHPNAVASAEMQRLGLNVIDVEKHVGSRGLTGTFQLLTEAILKNTHGGSVIAGTYVHMSAATKAYAQEILAGTITTGELTKATKTLSPEQATLLSHFKSLAVSATGVKQTYAGAMAAMTGGATGLNVSLALTGTHMKTFEANAKGISKAGSSGKALADDWTMSSKNLSSQIDIAKTSVENLGISVGLKLIPPVTALIKPIASFISYLAKLPGFGPVVIVLIATFLTLWAAIKIGTGAKEMFKGIEGAIKAFKGALMGATEAEGEAAGAQEGLNLAFLASPITWIVLGLVLIVAGIYELSKHCKAFRDFWKDAWKDITHWATVAFDWVKHNWPLILAILLGPVAVAALEIVKHWKSITKFASEMYHDVLSFFDKLGSGIMKVVSGFGHLLTSAGSALIHGLIGGVENEAGKLWGMIGNIGSKISGVFKSALSIFSPSKVFFEHGKNIILGLVGGINGYSHLGEDAIRSMAQKAINASGGNFHASAHGSNGNGTLTLEWVGTDQEIITLLKKWVRVRGGDPAIFGR